MLPDEDAVQAAIRERATGGPLAAFVPDERIVDEFPMAVKAKPRIGFHLSDMSAMPFDQGQSNWWDCYWAVVVEADTSAELKAITKALVAVYDGVGLVVDGHKTQGIKVDRVSGTTFDPETKTRGRVVSLRVLVKTES